MQARTLQVGEYDVRTRRVLKGYTRGTHRGILTCALQVGEYLVSLEAAPFAPARKMRIKVARHAKTTHPRVRARVGREAREDPRKRPICII